MLWDPASDEKDGEGEQHNVPVTPILVPLQNTPTTTEQNVPLLVPDVQGLKDQFQQQQNMLTQIKETLKQNESQLYSKEKQVEVYANKLSQIRARSKNTQAKNNNAIGITESAPIGSASKNLVKKSSKENIASSEVTDANKSSNSSKIGRRGKVSELKKCLEENKIKFEERTGKEQTETKKIESLVEQLKIQLEERDKTIQDLQKNIEQPTPKLGLPKRTKPKSEKQSMASKTTQTKQTQTADESIEIITLQNKICELKANVLDLEENLKEKESVIEARTQAVTLLSQDLSLKGKNTLENLEETRQEMRTMQNNFIAMEDELKKDLLERDNRLVAYEEKYKNLQTENFDLSVKNAELQEKLVKLQERYAEMEVEKKSIKDLANQSQPNMEVEELQKKVNVLTKELDDRNKAMIKMKIEHKNKIKNMNKTLETLKGTSDDKAEILKLCKTVEMLENVKTGLENRVAELEDEKATEKKLKDQINELEITIKKQSEELSLHVQKISDLEKENLDLVRASQDQNLVVENLYAKMLSLSSGADVVETEENSNMKEFAQKLKTMEDDYNRRLEDLKAEHEKEIEMLEFYYNSKIENADRKELEEYRISTEINNIHVEEQIELLIHEKQQLLEKLKSLSGVPLADSLAFEKMERSDVTDEKEATPQLDDLLTLTVEGDGENRLSHLQRIVNDQQNLINNLEKSVQVEKEKAKSYEQKIKELEEIVNGLEESNANFKQQIKSSDVAESGKNQKSNFNAKNKIKKIEMELAQTKKAMEEQTNKMKDLNEKLEEKEELIKKYTEKIELFEKDDWDRQNHWKNTEDNIDNVQELQKRCLSLENSLIELNEHCEKLRKENIEVVHLLSEEKVMRRKLLEESGSRLEYKENKSQGQGKELQNIEIEEKINSLNHLIVDLETKVEKLEVTLENQPSQKVEQSNEEEESWKIEELQQKLEWTNVVLTSKETEIFRLQNLLQDRSKMIEDMESDLNEYKTKLSEKENNIVALTDRCKAREVQLQEISSNFSKLQERADSASGKLAQKEFEHQELTASTKSMEKTLLMKEAELLEIKGILGQKNLDIDNLKNRIEEVKRDLTNSHKQDIEKMGKYLKDKQCDFDILLADKRQLENMIKDLIAEKEDANKQKEIIANEKEKLLQLLSEKEKLLTVLNEKINNSDKSLQEQKVSSQEMENLKIKMKKLAANLKKKAQNEKDLLKQVKDLESSIADKDKSLEKLHSDINEVTEKWTLEKSEKEQSRNELNAVLCQKADLENENASLKNKFVSLEEELENSRLMHEGQVRQLEDEIQKTYKICNDLQMIEQDYKKKVYDLETKLNDLSAQYENVSQAAKENRVAVEEEQKAKEVLLKKLAEATGKLEKIKFEHDQILLDKSNIENQVEELQKLHEETSGFDAKLQENLAVIENLESELMKAQDHIKYVEEKLFISEERRLSLESKNEEMCRKITEDSQNLTTIDDLANRVDELLKSEKSLKDSVNVQEAKNVKLKQELDEAELKKQKLDNEVKTLTEKIMEMTAELKQAKDTDVEKVGIINALTNDIEKLKGENKQILVEFDKLNRDYEQFEVDFKENLENSQNIEKSLKHKIEELTNENAAILEKLNLLSEDKTRNDEKTEEEVEDKKPKKRKSGTLRSDEVDLKKQLNLYNGKLKQANAEIENLKAELLREKLKSEMVSMVKEAEGKAESLKLITEEFTKEPLIQKTEVKSLSEKKPKEEERKFDASIFFGAGSGTRVEESTFFDDAVKIQPEGQPQTSDFESLMWDDGWGTDGQLEEEYMSTKVVEITAEPENHYKKQIKLLENEIESMKGELEKMSKELQEQTAKYTKALKKLKEQKIICEKLQSEVSKFKNNEGFGDLNAAIVDELKSQIENMEKKERELLKNIDNFKAEKESLLKRIDVLNAGNEKFLQMKERQDNDAELWQRKNNELLIEITTLRQQLAEPQILDDNALAQENRELLNKVEALEWKNCELTQLLEEKEELLEAREEASSTDVEKTTKEKSLLQKDIEELNKTIEFLKTKLSDEEKNSSATISSLNEQLTALAAENETFQEILNKMKSANASKKTNDADANFLNQKVKELEELSRVKDAEINQLQNLISENQNELDGQKEKLLQLQTEKEIETNTYKQRLLEVESVLRSKEEEMQHFVQQHQARESEILKKKATEEENSKTLVLNQFESIDLNQTVETLPYSENVGTESDALRQRVLELEELIRLKDEEMQRAQSNFVQYGNQEMDDLRQRNYQLQDFLRLKEEELGQLRTMAWNQDNANEMEQLRRQVQDLEEFLRFKENELFQVQALKSNEIQDLNLRIMDLENLLKAGDVSQNESLQQRIFELENLIRLTEEESHRIQSEKTSESENLRQKVQELENLLVCKDEEIKKLVTRLNDLEKSYNDSKIEIERLLNEEKLNAEEKFVEPFQKNIQIPVAFELEAISRSLDEEKQKAVNLQYELVDRDNIIEQKTAEIEYLRKKIADLELQLNNLCDVESSQKVIMDESYEMKAQLEKIITDLQKDLESSNLQLSETKRELEQLKNSKNEVMSNLKMQLNELETELVESTEKKDSEIMELKSELNEKTNFYESLLQSKREEEAAVMDKMKEEEKFKMESEKEVERLRSELSIKEEDILRLSEMLKDYESNSFQMREIINEKERELLDLRQTLIDVQEEIGHFRNFEKQVKELRVAQLKEAGSEVPVTDEGDPDLSDWTEHELVELSTRLQSDLDTALYMLHQRDVRCDELTFELMQLIEERDTLQLRLSTALRTNEELRSLNNKIDKFSSSHNLQENKDIVDQSNDRQAERSRVPSEDLRQLANKISELHSISYLRDKTVKDDSVQRHTEQMNLLSRVSDSGISLNREAQSTPGVILNWVRGKTTQKVMHI